MLIVANWKAYVDSAEKAKKLFATAKRLATYPDIDIVLAPSAPYLGLLAPGNRSKVGIAAQDLSTVSGGAATGEITSSMLRSLGVTHVILGHSERRALGETDAIVSEKVRQAFSNKIIPILCVGERERDADGKYLTFLRTQLHAIFSILSAKEKFQIIVAYEPIWAIGKTAEEAITPNDLTEMMLYIRKVIGAYIPGTGSSKVSVIYGGSVEPSNVKALTEETGIDGFLAGHASVDSDIFTGLVKAVR
ncbi:triosephosphate isomerase [Patescibacteria group bacterium]|nr:triosephosphate isomerase [Patescibacteria group bacterium]